jgi:signal transduction histidine kinase
VPAEDRPYVFDRFYRGRHANRAGGSGLGLSIAKWIVEKHGGSIALSSEPEGITELVIRLPLAADSLGAADRKSAATPREARHEGATLPPRAQSTEMV